MKKELQETHRAWTNPEILLLYVLHTLVNAFIPQHLQRATEGRTLSVVLLKQTHAEIMSVKTV